MSKPNIPKSLKGRIAVLQLTSYNDWIGQIGKKTRNMIRKSQRCGVVVSVGSVDAVGVWKIYNETPIRQGRCFNHYGVTLETVKAKIATSKSVFVSAKFEGELVGFIELIVDGNTGVISQILSFVSMRDKAVNNALIAKTVEYACTVGLEFLVYARFGNHPSLDQFKLNNGFWPYRNGWRVSDFVPERVKAGLIPVYNKLQFQNK